MSKTRYFIYYLQMRLTIVFDLYDQTLQSRLLRRLRYWHEFDASTWHRFCRPYVVSLCKMFQTRERKMDASPVNNTEQL